MSIQTLAAQFAYYDSYSDYSSYSDSDSAVAAGVGLFMMGFVFFILVATYVVSALLLSRIFTKAGIEGWKAWVPFYNNWTLLEMGGQKGYWAVLAIIPIVNIASMVFMYIAMYNIGLKFGKEGAFILWAIFVPLVWYIWLAVDQSKWEDAKVPTTKKPQATPKKAA